MILTTYAKVKIIGEASLEMNLIFNKILYKNIHYFYHIND